MLVADQGADSVISTKILTGLHAQFNQQLLRQQLSQQLNQVQQLASILQMRPN